MINAVSMKCTHHDREVHGHDAGDDAQRVAVVEARDAAAHLQDFALCRIHTNIV